MSLFRLSFAGAATAVLLASAATAHAETKSFRDFLAACDNANDCVVYGLPEAAHGAYIKIERGGAPDAAPKATIKVDYLAASAFTLAFDEPDSRELLPSGPLNRASKDEESKHIVIDKPQAVAALVVAIGRAKSLRVTRQDPPGVDPSDPVETEISMDGAIEALQWVDKRQRRSRTQSAFIRSLTVSILVFPLNDAPALPTIAAPKINTAPMATEVPTTLDPKKNAKARKLCGAKQGNAEFSGAARLDGNRVLYSYLCPTMSGAYNKAYKFLVASEDAPQNAREPRFILPPELSTEEKSKFAMNASFDAKAATLTTFAKARGVGDCGFEAKWTWDGQAFRTLQYRSMPTCRGVQPDDWPTVYRATVK